MLWGTLRYAMDHVRQQAARTDEVTIRLLNDLSRTALLTDEFAELQAFIEGDQQGPANSRRRSLPTPPTGSIAASDVALDRIAAAGDAGRAAHLLAERRHREPRRSLGLARDRVLGRPASSSAYSETRNLGIKIAAVGMVLIALVGLGMGFVLTRRLQSLADAADRVAASDTTVRVEVSGRDEVARVGRAFNSMVDRMADSVKALEAARDRLVQPAEAMSEGFALWDADDRLVLYNSKFGDMFEGARRSSGARQDLRGAVHLFHEHVLAVEARPPLDGMAGRPREPPSPDARPARDAPA